MKKFWNNIVHVHLDILCLYTSFCKKKKHLLCPVQKKIIFYVQNMIVHMTFFVFLYRTHKMSIPPKNLCANIECPYVHAKFYLRSFDIFKLYLFCILYNIGSYAPMCQNTTSNLDELPWYEDLGSVLKALDFPIKGKKYVEDGRPGQTRPKRSWIQKDSIRTWRRTQKP
jgi:hypothetical protein